MQLSGGFASLISERSRLKIYHTLYRQLRETWPVVPFKEEVRWLSRRDGLVVGDFGCGEAFIAAEAGDQKIEVDCAPELDRIRAIGRGTVLQLEQVLTELRLPVILEQIKPGEKVLIYTHYVGWQLGYVRGLECDRGLVGGDGSEQLRVINSAPSTPAASTAIFDSENDGIAVVLRAAQGALAQRTSSPPPR